MTRDGQIKVRLPGIELIQRSVNAWRPCVQSSTKLAHLPCK